MNIRGKTAIVTGANRGLGQAYAKALLEAGARKVYAGARDPASVTLPGVTPVKQVKAGFALSNSPHLADQRGRSAYRYLQRMGEVIGGECTQPRAVASVHVT